MQAETRIGWLMRTLDEAAIAWDGRSVGGGVILMPSMWSEGSYAELLLRLAELRSDGPANRAIWWHTTRRFRYGEIRRLVVPLRSLKGRDPKPLLPSNARLVADGEREGRKRAKVICYVWDPRVSEHAAARGLDALVATMFSGDRQRITLPPSVLAQVSGRSP